MSDPLEYMNRFAQWTVEEDVPEYNTQWAGKLAEACVEIANRDDQIAALRAENERLTARVEAAERERDGLSDKLHQMTHNCVGAEMERDALKEVLRRIEFIENGDVYECPVCRQEKPGHFVDCDLAAALQAEGAK